jgi:hypothetical protein
MTVKVTLTVESTGHAGDKNEMTKSLETGNVNERFYPSQIEHMGAQLTIWASGRMTNLIGGKDKTLSDQGAMMLVEQRALIAAVEQAQAFRDFEKTQGDQVLVDRETLEFLRKRAARLTALEVAGVDNWEGMDHVKFPED